MNSFNRFQSQSHSPSAPPLPESSGQQPSYLQRPPGGQLGHSPPPPYSSPYSSGYSSFPSYGGGFPPGTHPDIIRSFQAVDRDRSGFIDEKELQAALSTGYQKFSLRTIRLLIFLFKNPNDPSPRGLVSLQHYGTVLDNGGQSLKDSIEIGVGKLTRWN